MQTYERLTLLFGALVPLACGRGVPPYDPAGARVLPDAQVTRTGGDRPAFVLGLCETTSTLWPALNGVVFAAPRPDYVRLQLRETMGLRSRNGRSTPNVIGIGTLVAAWGSECAGASDENACRRSVARALTSSTLLDDPDSTSPYLLVVRRGDEVFVVQTWRDVKSLLGQVDSLGDAGLLVAMRGYRLTCDESTGEAAARGWVVTAASYDECGHHRADHVFDVSSAGDVSIRLTIVRQKEMRCYPGRRPAGLGPVLAPVHSEPGDFLARSAELEAAMPLATLMGPSIVRIMGPGGSPSTGHHHDRIGPAVSSPGAGRRPATQAA